MRTVCPHCGSLTEVPDGHRTGECPACHSRFDAIADARTVAGTGAPAGAPAAGPTPETERVTCSGCGTELDLRVQRPPTTCPNCGAALPHAQAAEAPVTGAADVRDAKTVIGAHPRRPAAEEQPGVEALDWMQSHFGDRYELLAFVARGGMGAIYKARQRRPSRVVALKVMLGGAFASPRHLRRFEREAEAIARLNHPAIVPVYDYGEAGGQPYFSMEFIEGQDLAAYALTHGLDRRGVCRLMVQICEAVDFAHTHGVIHRDLKPGNIMVDQRDQPRILDFGLSRISREEDEQRSLLTGTGDFIGTPRYMSPEQALGLPEEIDGRTDVFALGVILYELLVGVLPYPIEQARGMRLFEVFREHEPLNPSLLLPDFPRDLEIILLKAVAPDKAQRYRTAQQLGEDLQNWLEDRPINARPATRGYRLAKWAARNRQVLKAVSVPLAVLLLVVGVLVAVIISKSQADARARQVYVDLKAGDRSAAEAVSRYVDADTWQKALTVAEEAVAYDSGEPNVEGLVWKVGYSAERRADAAVESYRAAVRRQDYGEAERLAADGRALAARLIPYPELQQRLDTALASPDESYWRDLQEAVSQDYDRDAALGRLRAYLDRLPASTHGDEARELLAGTEKLTATAWLARDLRAAERALAERRWEAADAALSSAQKLLEGAEPAAAERWAGRVQEMAEQLGRVVRPGTAQRVGVLTVVRESGSPVKAVAPAPDGQSFALARFGGAVEVRALPTGTLVRSFEGEGEARSVAFSPDGAALASGRSAGRALVWSLADGALLHELRGNRARVESLAFSPDGGRLLTACVSRAVLWELAPGGAQNEPLPGAEAPAACSPDGRLVGAAFEPSRPELEAAAEAGYEPSAGGAQPRFTGLWETALHRRVQAFYASPPEAMTFSPDGRALATAHCENGQRVVRFWDILKGAPELEIAVRAGAETPLTKQYWGLAVSPDGRLMATTDWSGRLAVWDIAGRALLAEFDCDSVPYCVMFTPDQQLIITGHNNGEVSVWGIGPAPAPPAAEGAGG